MPRQLRVFLCHASQDKPIVRELYQRLKAEEWIDPWLDEEKLSFGQHWTTAIEDALSEADVVIIFLSKNSVQKEGFVQRELNYAWELSLEKPRNVIFLIPFRLDDCQIPRYLGSRQWGDYFGEKKENIYQILLRSLKQRHQQKLKLEAEEEAEHERVGREAAEKVALERQEEARKKAELEFIEKAKLKEAKKKTEWEAAERIAREKAERKNIELAQAEQSVGRVFNPIITTNEKASLAASPIYSNQKDESSRRLPVFAMGLFSFFIISLLVWGMWVVSNQDNLPIQTSIESFTSTPQITVASLTSSPAVTPTLDIGSTMISEKDGMVMLYVPAGEFTMGSNNGNIDEKPEHQVYLDAFWIDQTEVTNAMYAKCVTKGDCTPPSSIKTGVFDYTHDAYYNNSKFDDYPVIGVTWYQANAYCTWTERRLPTEAEWEKAARGTDGRTYPWGENISCNFANYDARSQDCVGGATSVGSYPDGASIYGALDMAGNVWEWVSSLYTPYPYDENDGREDLSANGSRVLRGGSWEEYDTLHSANRNGLVPTGEDYFLGFRCSLSP